MQLDNPKGRRYLTSYLHKVIFAITGHPIPGALAVRNNTQSITYHKNFRGQPLAEPAA